MLSIPGRDVLLDNPPGGGQSLLRGAMAWSTVLSLVALDELVPLLAAAVDGDPSTVPAS